jgi:hypothetical protein
MPPMKPSIKISDHHDMVSNRMPRVSALGEHVGVGVEISTQRLLVR